MPIGYAVFPSTVRAAIIQMPHSKQPRAFTPKVREKLGRYVYLYIDPRDGSPFYVGKGMGNRCFSHLNDRSNSQKAKVISQLGKLGLEPRIEILKYGLTEGQALLVESTAIELLGLENLTNRVKGHGGNFQSREGVREIQDSLAAVPVRVSDPVVLITINRLYTPDMNLVDLYDATRSAWRLNPDRHDPRFALSVFRGIVRGVFSIAAWVPAGSTLRACDLDGDPRPPGKRPGRVEFVGAPASAEVQKKYLGKSVKAYLPQGSQNPIKFVNC